MPSRVLMSSVPPLSLPDCTCELVLHRSRPIGRSFCHFNYHLNLDGIVERKARHSDSRSRVFADCLAEDLHHQIGKSVDDLWLVTKTFGRVDHPKDFDYALHAVQAAKRGTHLRQHDQTNLARRVIAFLYGEVLAHLAFVLPIGSRSVSRKE